MVKQGQTRQFGFWVRVSATCAGLLALVALAEAAPRLYRTAAGRYPATLLSVMKSREILDNPGVTGYYERLLANTGSMDRIYQFDHSFRVFRFRPNLTWQHDLVTTNSFGMVGPECSLTKAPGTRRIALLGGSLSSGHMIHSDETFGALFERRLNGEGLGQRFELLNFACVAYTMTQVMDVAIEDVPRFHPDVYLVDVNELGVYRQWDRHLVQLIQRGIDPKYDFLRDTLQQAGVKATDDPLILHGKLAPYRLPVLKETFVRLKAAVARQNAQLVVILVPAVEAGNLSQKRVEGIREVLDSLHITTVDLLDTFDGILDTARLAAWRGDVHPNAEGHAMIARNLYTKLRAQPAAWRALTGSEVNGVAAGH